MWGWTPITQRRITEEKDGSKKEERFPFILEDEKKTKRSRKYKLKLVNWRKKQWKKRTIITIEKSLPVSRKENRGTKRELETEEWGDCVPEWLRKLPQKKGDGGARPEMETYVVSGS